MKLKEDGFSGAYHHVCAFELNDKLREIIKDCPDAEKASHAVFYGYVDPKQGLMLELLGAGKKATKYFYFKDAYTGDRVSVPAKEIADVEFIFFPKLQKSDHARYDARIDPLKKYNAPEEVENLRGENFGFLDGFRDLRHPDVVRVTFYKEGLKPETLPVLFTGTGDHCLTGNLQKEPKQDFGPHKGDTIEFYARKNEKEEVEIYLELGEPEKPHELTREDLDNGSFLKYFIGEFRKDTENEEKFNFLLAVLRSSSVFVPCDTELSEESAAIWEKLKKAGKNPDSLEGAEEEKFWSGVRFNPRILVSEGDRYLPAFTSETETNGEFDDAASLNMPFVRAIEMAQENEPGVSGIVVNAYTDNFVVKKKMVKAISELKPLFEEQNEQKSENGIKGFTNHENLALAVTLEKMTAFNYALYQNKVNPIQGIRVINETGENLTGLSLRISSDFDFFTAYEISLPCIPSGKPIPIPDPRLRINAEKLASLTDEVIALVTIELRRNEETICGVKGHMQVLAYDQWMGGTGYRYLLPAFVIPAHPVIPALMHDAADRLEKWGKSSSLEGYQEQDPNRVRDLAAAAFAAIQKKNIVYAEPPASYFEGIGQQIRTPETIMEQRLGTCMDMTLLYTALLEAIGLHPLLVLIKGHIFAGVWLRERTPEEMRTSDVITDDVEQLLMRIDNGTDELTFVECTAMCAGQMSFEEAEAAAKRNLLNPQKFEMAIDVQLSRRYGIKPIPPRMKENGSVRIEVTDKAEDELTDAPTDHGITVAEVTEVKAKKITNKRELWESKLLDLSTRNMLLNLPLNASVQPVMSSHIDELEDALSDGHEFNLFPVPEWIAGQWLANAIEKIGVFEMSHWPAGSDFDFNEKFRQEYRNHRVYTYCTPKQLDRDLTAIYRAARASQQENGVSSLYLSIGLLRWFADAESHEPCYAPLILLPIEIVRKSANQGYALHAREDDPHFNTTLLEMLKQNFNLNIGGLDPLPTDEHGTDIKKVFAIVRNALFTVKGWDVVETCVIGNFSFAQFAMWNDIHTAGDALDNNKIVRSLMKGHVDWDAAASDNSGEKQTYLPITVDATQLQAIKMAANGTTFVLHGPPGTGKSQTITGMIANLMAQGKRVLFVAEKMAALSVVQKRLSALGIGDFCLELHSDKANKKQVLSQLDRALAVKHPSGQTEYEEYLAKTTASRAKLDGYAKHLHAVHEGGYSLRELIDLYETVRDAEHCISFDRSEAGKLTKDQIRSHSALIHRLIAAGEAVGGINSHPLIGIGLTSYSAEIRGSLYTFAENYRWALEAVRVAGAEAAALIGAATPKNKKELRELNNLVVLYKEEKNTDPLFFELLKIDSAPAYEYFARKAVVEAEEKSLLTTWEPEFLTMDMSDFLAKHEAAGKKFFGKMSAMSAVTAEIRKYSRVGISFEQIPSLLRSVIQHQEKLRQLENKFTALPENIRKLINRFGTEEAYSTAVKSAEECKAAAAAFPGGSNAIFELAGDSDKDKILENFRESVANMLQEEQRLDDLLERHEDEDNSDWIESEIKICSYLMDHSASLKDWSLYNQVRKECVNAGLKPVTEAYERELDAKDVETAYRKGLYYALINYIINTDDELSCFSGATFNEAIQQFKRLDDLMLQQTKQEIYYLLASRVPSSWDSPEVGMEMNLLRKAVGSNARGMSIRTLFDRIPHILPALCPCMLMSPNSVAQYLAQDNSLFDVVIFDEASQLPTCKAVGALYRAKDAVIVGDPKQMPPTAFFSGAGPEVDDLALDDLDSILDDALALGIPSQHLQWHYRSTHESLIAFSNSQFYENRMYTFPSANDRERHVTAVHVEGSYAKSVNTKEAEAVVEEIVRRFYDPKLKKQSIGVVTFNVKQQALIENLLAKQFQSNPELDMWANSGEDPLFVKNLENVQGDERDVILFSIGYGPDEKGNISMNFGPINKPGGGKRLNVAFSRARITMTIFASLYSSDIKVTENSPEGLIAFHDFLKFAEGKDIRTDSLETEAKLARAGILKSICQTITEHGYRCETMVGHSDFHVDIAVVDPFIPTKYMLGILLDGEGYHRTKNTRDREVSQISVLKNLGWTLLRVWTIDWWDNREKVIRKLLEGLDGLKIESEKKLEEAKAVEDKLQEDKIAQIEKAEKLKAELEAQTAEVVAEDEAAEKESKAYNAPVSEPDTVIDAPQSVPSAEISDLLQKITEANGTIVDKRGNGGALWVVGGKELAPVMEQFESLGVHFIFKLGGGKATNGRDGWWAKTDIEIPASEAENETADTPEKERTEKIITETVNAETVNAETVNIETVNAETVNIEKVNIGISEPAETENTIENTGRSFVTEKEIEPAEYKDAILPETSMSQAEFAAPGNKTEIASRILTVLNAEAPILKDTLFRKIWSSFKIVKTNAAIEATEKALKYLKVKTTKQKGIVYCWAADQDPKTYGGIRISNIRSGDEICPQEIKNAVCYVLKNKGKLAKDALIKEVSLLFGYKRLGKNLEDALVAGVQYARSSGAVDSVPGGYFELHIAPDRAAEQSVTTETLSEETILICESSTYKATGFLQSTGFTVLKGSKINSTTTPSCPASALKMREKYADSIGKDFVLTGDVSFSSSSGAAEFVAGASRNGYTEWHTENGTLLRDLIKS